MTHFVRKHFVWEIWTGCRSVAFSAVIFWALLSPATATEFYFGTGGDAAGKPAGIYQSKFEPKTGTFGQIETVIALQGAGWITQHPTLKILYSTGIIDGAASIVAVDRSQPPATIINAQSTGSGRSCFVTTDRDGKMLISAQYGGSSVSVFPLNEDGSIAGISQLIQHGPPSVVHKNQDAAHPHYVAISSDNRFAWVCDLGMDKIIGYEIDNEKCQLKEAFQADAVAGGGPRHMKFHPSGKFALVLNELNLTVSVFKHDQDAATLTMVGTTEALTAEEKSANSFNSGSEIRVHPNGKFVYSANRGHDSISVFHFDPQSGQLNRTGVMPTRGAWPRNFNLTADGQFLICANKDTNSVSVFTVDQQTGGLQYKIHSPIFVPSPICVLPVVR